MAVTISVRVDDQDQVLACLGSQLLATTCIADLPSLERLQADAYHLGQTLLVALGGGALLQRLNEDAERLLLLDLDTRAEGIAWEFATLPDHQFLVVQYGCLRLVNRVAPPSPSGTLNFVALAADPLVDEQGKPCEGYRLKLEDELRAIRNTLTQRSVALEAHRVPPTVAELRRALRRGPAILHLTCHGGVVTSESGPMALLTLEDENGKLQPLLGRDLALMAPRGALRMVLLSACKTAEGRTDSMARGLVWQGVPFAVGMQSAFPDPLSDTVATAFYDTLLIGQPLDVALQQARQALSADPAALGLLVGYTARDGWRPIPLQSGTPWVDRLGLPGTARLTSEVQPARPLLGRNRELHQLAQLYSSGRKVVTICGTGGMGKTALAATFAERFCWRWPRGVRTISFASEVLNAREFNASLLRELLGEERARALADLSANDQVVAILQVMRDWDGLLLLDNYETILQALGEDAHPGHMEAGAIHRLVAQLAAGGAMLLLTSRHQPAQLAGEVLFPGTDDPLSGLQLRAAAELFIHHSTRAKAQDKQSRTTLAEEVATRTDGHPLALALLAGEYDTWQGSVNDFLAGWADELAKAVRPGMATHHVTFAVAFDRSYRHLSEDVQHKLRLLSVFAFPFYAEGAALLWNLPLDGDGLKMVREAAGELAQRNLIEVDGQYKDGSVSAYRLQPAVRQEIARRVMPEEHEQQVRGFCAYGEWLAQRGYGDISNEPALAQRVRLSFDALDAAIQTLTGTDRLWHIRRVAWLKKAFGQTRAAHDLLLLALPADQSAPDPQAEPEAARADSSLRYELADVCVTFGNLERAMELYGQSLAIKEQLGDLKGKSATLHQMAGVWVTRGELERAMELYGQSLAIKEQLGDLKGKSATLHQMAGVWVTRGELERAMELYGQSLAVDEQLGDLQGKSATLHQMAGVWVTRGELERAMELYGQSLAVDEQLGDLQGKSATLSMMANVHMARDEWEKAEKCLAEALALARRIGDRQGIAFKTVKLGQVAQARGEQAHALAAYQEGLEIFQNLGMPGEAEQVRQMIADLQGTASSPPDPLQQMLADARAASQRGDPVNAVATQEQAVALFRERLAAQEGASHDEQVALSVLLYNLAGYYGEVERHADAVCALEEVVALDECTQHTDLASDRRALEAARRRAALSPEERARLQQAAHPAAEPDAPGSSQQPGAGSNAYLAQLREQLAALPPEQRAEAEAAVRDLAAHLSSLTPEQQDQYLRSLQDAQRRQRIASLADQARDGAIAALRGETPQDELIANIENVATRAAEGEQPGSPWAELALYLRAVVALLRGDALPPVPVAYVAHVAAIQAELTAGRSEEE